MGTTSTTRTPPGGARARGGLVPAASALLAAAVAVACSGADRDGERERATATQEQAPAGWVHLGNDLEHTRAATGEATLGPDTVAALRPAWTTGDLDGVTGTPIVDGGTVYVGDWTGHVRAFDAETGDERWARDLDTNYVAGAVALDDERVIAGTFDGRLVALDRATGEPRWETEVHDHPQAVVFGSPVAADGLVVAGVGSFEVFAGDAEPTFRGSVVAVDAETGEEAWTFWVTAGDETEGPGVSVWSSPAVDLERGHLYVGTGQAYAPPAPPRSDALLALDLRTGREVWASQFTAGDAWTLAQPTGLDADVGAAPNLFRADGVDAVGVGDKDGVYRALDRDTGEVLWEHRLTEGGLQGGVMAGAAVADGRVYVASNRASQDADLAALDVDTGEQAWRIDVGAHVTGPVTWANQVVYLADDAGRIGAYAAADGARLWSHEVDAPAAGGIAVTEGTAYAGWGWWLASPPPDPAGGLVAFRLESDEAGDATPDGTAGAPAGRSDDGSTGEDIHLESCATCHGASGEGASGPSLAGVADRLTRDEHLDVVRDGRGAMPGWQDTLDPDEIEAVVDYQRDVLTDARN